MLYIHLYFFAAWVGCVDDAIQEIHISLLDKNVTGNKAENVYITIFYQHKLLYVADVVQ